MGENRPDLTLDGHDTEPYQTLFKGKGGGYEAGEALDPDSWSSLAR